MNNSRRKDIRAIRAKLEALLLEIGNLKDEEEIAHGNLAENMQAGQKGQRMFDAIAGMDNAMTSINDASECLLRAER